MCVTTHGEFQFCLLYFFFTVGGAGSSCRMLEDKTNPALHFVLGFCYLAVLPRLRSTSSPSVGLLYLAHRFLDVQWRKHKCILHYELPNALGQTSVP